MLSIAVRRPDQLNPATQTGHSRIYRLTRDQRRYDQNIALARGQFFEPLCIGLRQLFERECEISICCKPPDAPLDSDNRVALQFVGALAGEICDDAEPGYLAREWQTCGAVPAIVSDIQGDNLGRGPAPAEACQSSAIGLDSVTAISIRTGASLVTGTLLVIAEALARFRIRDQLIFDAVIHGAFGVVPVGTSSAGIHPGQDADGFVNVANGVNGEHSFPDRVQDVLPQHQVPDVIRGHYDAV